MREYALEAKNQIKELIKEKTKAGVRFSVTTDEYSSKRVRRYCDINVHFPGGDIISIGMVRVHGSLPAEKAASLLRKKLLEFGLKEGKGGNVVAVTTDAASVMRKMGRILDMIHQLCHAHGLHLGM